MSRGQFIIVWQLNTYIRSEFSNQTGKIQGYQDNALYPKNIHLVVIEP